MNVPNSFLVRGTVLLVATAAICVGLYMSFLGSLTKQKLKFETDAQIVAASFRSALDVVDGIATSLNALQIGRPETQVSFAHTILDNYPFVSGFGRFSRVSGDRVVEFSEFQSALNPNGGPAVWWFDENDNRVTIGAASEVAVVDQINRPYYPVTNSYLSSGEPADHASAGVDGFDLGSISEFADTIRQATEQGRTEFVNAPYRWPNPDRVFAVRSLYQGGVMPEKITDRRDAMVGGYWLEIDFNALGLPAELTEKLGLSFLQIESESEFSMEDSAVMFDRALPDSDLLFSQWLQPHEWVGSFLVANKTYTIRLSQQSGMTLLNFLVWLCVAGAIVGTLAAIAVLNAKRLKAVRKQRLDSEKLFLEQQRAAVTLLHVGDSVISTNIDGGVEYVNKAAIEMLEIIPDDIIGCPIQTIFRDAGNDQGLLAVLNQEREFWYLSEDVVRRDRFLLRVDGSRIAVNETVSPVHDADGHRIGSVVVLRDVTAEKELTEQLEYQINHDPLTGLANRLSFERRMRNLFEGASSEQPGHALCLIDLDRFKQVNDTCGHAAGDKLLRGLASALGERVRAEDLLARLGGDEFAVVIEHCDLDAAASLANRLLQFFNNYHFEYDKNVFPVRGSIGLVHFDPTQSDFESVVSAADVACYKAKNGGRNAIYVYSDEDREGDDSQVQEMWLPHIEQAISTGNFELYFQPVCAVNNADFTNPVYHELLVRMRDKRNNGKLYSPTEFLKSAERYGLMAQIDEWVIMAALEFVAGLPDGDQRRIFSINLSAASLDRVDLYPFLCRQLMQYPVFTEQLCFELTEEAVLNNFEASKSAIASMKKLGCKVALDNFGSGVSSLSALRELSIDYLKIDGQFCSRVDQSPADECMVRSIHSFAVAMGLQTIAEKVESTEAFNRLADIGVDHIQGYAVARPLSVSDFHLANKAA